LAGGVPGSPTLPEEFIMTMASMETRSAGASPAVIAELISTREAVGPPNPTEALFVTIEREIAASQSEHTPPAVADLLPKAWRAAIESPRT
jgi:hypothetical protein